MIEIFLGGFSSHKLAVWGLTGFSTLSVVLAAVTGDQVILGIGTAGGVALGIVALRDKMRDYRAEALHKQIEGLSSYVGTLEKQLDDERADHEQTRQLLRKALRELADKPSP